MIKINLANKKQSAALLPKAGTAVQSGIDLKSLKNFRIDSEMLRDLLSAPKAFKTFVPIGVGMMAWLAVTAYQDAALRELDSQLSEVQSEKTLLTGRVQQLKSLEEAKKSIESDEQILKVKLAAVRKLMSDRGGATQILVALANSIPKEVWLSECSVIDSQIMLRGSSLKFNLISDFMKNLGENVLFSDLNMKSTRVVKDEAGFEFPNFELELKRKQQ